MSASTNPPADPELLRLLDAYRDVCQRAWLSEYRTVSSGRERAALLHYVAQHYIRRDRLVPDEWDNLDTTAEESPGPPIVTGPLARRAVRIRLTDGE